MSLGPPSKATPRLPLRLLLVVLVISRVLVFPLVFCRIVACFSNSWQLSRLEVPKKVTKKLGVRDQVSPGQSPVVIITWVRYQSGTLLTSTRDEKVEKSDGGDSREQF